VHVMDRSIIRGISYGLSPKRTEGNLPDDDMFSEQARPQWGTPGRGDLDIMARMGANTVRLYGNDPREDHTSFLDQAYILGLRVMPGLSDWPYLQAPESCRFSSSNNCYEQVKEAYMMNLLNGFVSNRTLQYHPALKRSHIIVINEPDMKMPSIKEPMAVAKSVISAIDGMVDAEKERGVVGKLPNFTATMSFSICSECARFDEEPGLGQMWTLQDAMLNPERYGYHPKNNLKTIYETRFVHSLNTGNPARELPELFLQPYSKEFHSTPFFIAEYHSPNYGVRDDLVQIMEHAKTDALFLGVSFFEWQNREDANGHTDYGIFELGHRSLMEFSFFGETYELRCLAPVADIYGDSVPAAIAHAYGGTYEQDMDCELGGEVPHFKTTTTTTTTTTLWGQHADDTQYAYSEYGYLRGSRARTPALRR